MGEHFEAEKVIKLTLKLPHQNFNGLHKKVYLTRHELSDFVFSQLEER